MTLKKSGRRQKMRKFKGDTPSFSASASNFGWRPTLLYTSHQGPVKRPFDSFSVMAVHRQKQRCWEMPSRNEINRSFVFPSYQVFPPCIIDDFWCHITYWYSISVTSHATYAIGSRLCLVPKLIIFPCGQAYGQCLGMWKFHFCTARYILLDCHAGFWQLI